MAGFLNFYSQWNYQDILKMPQAEYNFHLENMKRCKARERLELLQLHIYTAAKDATQTAIHKKLVREANPPAEIAKRAVNNDDLAGFGNNIEDVIKGK